VPLPDVMARLSRYIPPGDEGAPTLPLTIVGPVPGSSENSNDTFNHTLNAPKL
jgi:hypothetical protein